MNRRPSGLTLLETLTALAIIAIMLAAVLPALMRSRTFAKRTSCLAGLQSIYAAMAMYTSDFDGAYPQASSGTFVNGNNFGGATWRDLIGGYIKSSTFPRCPDVQTPGRLVNAQSGSWTCGFAYNLAFMNTTVFATNRTTMAGKQESVVRYPAATVLVFDARSGIDALAKPDQNPSMANTEAIWLFKFEPDIVAQTPGAFRHRGGADYLFADGHVRWFKPEDIQAGANENDPGFGL